MTFADDLHAPGSRSEIKREFLLIVEGRDMFGFFLKMVRELGLDEIIEVRNFGGVDDLRGYLDALPDMSGFHYVKSLAVVRDCESDPQAAFLSVCSGLSSAGFAEPAAPLQPAGDDPEIRILLLPDANTPGMLETLCWRSVADDPIVPSVDQFVQCVTDATGSPVPNPDKSRVHAFIAANDKPELLLGQAVNANLFPLDSPSFDDVKAFLRSLANRSA